MHLSASRLLLLVLTASTSLVGCSKPKPEAESTTPSPQQERAARAAEVPPPFQEKWTILNRIRQDESLLIGRTLLNEQNELGLVFDTSVTAEKIPDLMHRVMTEMARDFPHEDITVAAYGSATPPRPLGSAHLNGQTGEITFTPAK